MNTKKWAFLLIAALLAPAAHLGADDEAAKHDPSFWMKKKLEFSQEILSGIATADFPKIGEHAKAMRGLNRIEKFSRGMGTPGYRTQLQTFEFANDELVRAAEEENVDAAALAFTQLTLSCVNCHKQLRAR